VTFEDLVSDYNKLLTKLHATEEEKNSPRQLMTKYIYQKLSAQRGDKHFQKKHLNVDELIAKLPDRETGIATSFGQTYRILQNPTESYMKFVHVPVVVG
jgi:hypothetical protein